MIHVKQERVQDHLKVVVKLSNFHKIGKYGKELGEKSENYKT